MTWQSESIYGDGPGSESHSKSSTVTPLIFDSIATEGVDGEQRLRDDPDARAARAASDAEQNRKQLEDLHEAALESSIKRAREDERDRCESEFEEVINRERQALTRFREQLNSERNHYFEKVEEQIVKLALGIAARILHREVKLDPLLLRGVVQVALKQIQEGSEVTVRVATEDADAWSSRLDGNKSGLEIKVLADDRLAAGDCVVETDIGAVNLGIEAQLSEIEHGFFDLLKQRPV